MTRFILIALSALALTLIPVRAEAAIDDAGADHLKGMFAKYIQERQATMKLSRQDLRTDGPLTVEPVQGKYYAVTLPHLAVYNADGTHTDIGIFAINAMPGNTPGEWKFSLASPTPITGYTAAGTPSYTITLGSQSFNGLWDESIENFTKLDASYSNIVFQSDEKGIMVNVPNASVVYNLTKNADGKTWSGPVSYKISNLEFTKAGDSAVSKIGGIAVDMTMKDYDPTRVKIYQDKILSFASAGGTFTPGQMTPEQARAISAPFYDFITTAWSGFTSKMTFTDINISLPGTATDAPSNITLKQANMGFDMDGFRTKTLKIVFDVGYDGLTISPPTEAFTDTVPSHTKIQLTFDKIPFKDLMEAGLIAPSPENAARMTPAELQKATSLQMAKIVPQLLTAAGTSAQLIQSSLGNSLYNVLANGELDANLKTTMGATGKMTVEVSGMDALLAAIKKQIDDPNTPPAGKANLQKSLAMVTVFQTIGQQGKSAQGQPMRTYTLELNDQGKIMLNGADMSAIQAMAGAAAKAGQ